MNGWWRRGVRLILLVVLGLQASPGPVATEQSGTEAVANFDKLKALAGRWEGRHSDGSPAKASYEVLSRDSVVAEFLTDESGGTMLTVYHLDQHDLRLTHYCSAQNQPRMKATSVSPGARVIVFDFVDATNLAQPSDGHMRGLKISFLDEDNIEQEWTWREGGQETREIIRLSRMKETEGPSAKEVQ